MDNLHSVLRAIRPETKSGHDHLSVFREFLAHLDTLQRQVLTAKPRAKAPVQRKSQRRTKV